MNRPFSLNLQLKQLNANPAYSVLDASHYPIRITLSHTPQDVYHSIWFNSDNFQLKPVFLRLQRHGQTLPQLTFSEILGVEEVHDSVDDIELVIDYQLMGNRSIPARDPVEELFDIIIEWSSQDTSQTIKIRESLRCSIVDIKSYITEELNKTSEGSTDGSKIKLNYVGNDHEITMEDCHNGLKISDIIGLDVVPLHPIIFSASYNFPILERNTRFFIKIISNIDNLNHEKSLCEVNSKTSLREFINILIEKIDFLHTKRTFFDQVKLTYQNVMICEEANFGKLMIEFLDDVTEGKIFEMKLNIHDHVSGVEGGILSRQFWNDLTTSNLDFQPHRNDADLMLSQAPGSRSIDNINNENNDSNGNDNDIIQSNREIDQISSIAPFNRFEPTRIVLHNGIEWQLTGDTYEMIDVNPTTVDPTHQPRQLLINQSDLSSVEYEFKANDKTVLLNSSQCIIVKHQGYILLNPSGAAKLNREFNIQQVQVNMYDPVSTTSHPTSASTSTSIPTPIPTPTEPLRDPNPVNVPLNGHVNNADTINQQREQVERQNNRFVGDFFHHNEDNIINRLFNYVRRRDRNFYFNILKAGLIIMVLRLDDILLNAKLVTILLVIISFYAIIFQSNWVINRLQQVRPRNENGVVIRENIIRKIEIIKNNRERLSGMIQMKLVKTLIRKRDYEYVLIQHNHQDTLQFYIKENVYNFLKDITLFMVTFMPSIVDKLEIEVDRWNATELEDLKGEVLKIYDEYRRFITVREDEEQQQEDDDSDAEINIEEITAIELDTEELKEEKYQELLAYYLKFHDKVKLLKSPIH